ncbi:hypothetical protein F5984_18635 [Rudanella paleaurantiibacter]|uniref:Uncharacterized protein n=1 Tax=Rudanella paleaurantiibacter TaxID=2614655 RepID=A0A7J5TVR9_9BACT|nr:hypothetical protein [Rudanella paleaurantiibacter]KAB7728390.1 hypothetical protein F5984_18635 [Rudanella paleaurantiibacter]
MKHLLPVILLFFVSERSLAQEAIYFANGDKLPNARLADATEDKVVLSVKRDNGPSTYSFQRSNVLMAFNAAGDFLVISTLPADAASARQQIEQFSTAKTSNRQSDFLVKAVPFTVIPATISYESEQVINYKTLQGTAASINKDELVMVLRKDGRHQLIMAPTDVVSLLPTIRQQVLAGGAPEPVSTVAKTEPTVPVAATGTSETVVSGPKPNTSETANVPAVVVVVNTGQQASDPSTPAVNSPVSTPVTAVAVAKARPTLSDSEYESYRVKALQRVDEFSGYLNVITNKSIPLDRRDQAIEQAVRLFMPTATIEVTSTNRPGSRRYPIREYLTRLKLLPYSRTNIEWSEIQYIRELTQAADGNYYGTITGQQTFTGYGGPGGRNVLYSDVTQKNVRVKLQSYEKTVNGEGQLNWQVLLGNIGVANN